MLKILGLVTITIAVLVVSMVGVPINFGPATDYRLDNIL